MLFARSDRTQRKIQTAARLMNEKNNCFFPLKVKTIHSTLEIKIVNGYAQKNIMNETKKVHTEK